VVPSGVLDAVVGRKRFILSLDGGSDEVRTNKHTAERVNEVV